MAVSRLAGLSPTEIDPATVSVGVALPPGVGILAGSARLFLGAERAGTGETEGTTARLVARDDGRWAVAPEDAAALRETRAVIRRWKAEAPGTVGTPSVAVGGCVEGSAPGIDPRISVDLVLSPGQAPLALVEAAPLSAAIGNAALPACDD